MFIRRLKLAHFRNYRHLEIEADPGIFALIGFNGSGKTNILEAIHFLCMTRCNQALQDTQIMQHGADFFRAEAIVQHDGKQHHVAAKCQPGKQKVFETDGKVCDKQADHIGRFPVVMVAPDDQNLIMEGSENRRKFLDAMIAQMDHDYLRDLMVYGKVLRQRNQYLKDTAGQQTFEPLLLESYDQKLIPPAGRIARRRSEVISLYGSLFNTAYQSIAGSHETVDISYFSPLLSADMGEILRKNASRDRILQRTTSGVHKDDLLINLNGNPVKKYASQGQRKSIVLALRFAQYALMKESMKQKPLLLLDDIFAKLDIRRVERIFTWLGDGAFDQVWITDTDRERIEHISRQHGIPVNWYLIDAGTATREQGILPEK